jgi:hypothetical protein
MFVEKLNTLQIVSSREKGKTIHSEARKMIYNANHQYEQDAVEKSLVLPICRADERTANCCGVSVATVKQIRRESRERNYAELMRYIFDKVHMFPPQCPPILSRSNLFSCVTHSAHGKNICVTRIIENYIIPVVLYACETLSLT